MGIFDFKQKKEVRTSQASFAMESLPTPPPLHEFPSNDSSLKFPGETQGFNPPPLPNLEPIGQKPQTPPPDLKQISWPAQSAQDQPQMPSTSFDFPKAANPPSYQDTFSIPKPISPTASLANDPFGIPKPLEQPQRPSLPSFGDTGSSMQQTPKVLPKELPQFSFAPKKEVAVPVPSGQGMKAKIPEHDVEVPMPPPNLRSEISPLELERLEEKYLDRRPRISDVEHDYKYSRHEKLTKPLFVRTDDYKQILNNFIDIKDVLSESEETIYRMENLKKNSDVEYVEFKKAIEEIQRKLIYVDKTIFEN
ncbi:MAG: hypothetical protein V1859_06585 [archaeon]